MWNEKNSGGWCIDYYRPFVGGFDCLFIWFWVFVVSSYSNKGQAIVSRTPYQPCGNINHENDRNVKRFRYCFFHRKKKPGWMTMKTNQFDWSECHETLINLLLFCSFRCLYVRTHHARTHTHAHTRARPRTQEAYTYNLQPTTDLTVTNTEIRRPSLPLPLQCTGSTERTYRPYNYV